MPSGGSICLAGTDIQDAKGISDSEQLLIDDLRRVGGNLNDPEVVHAYTTSQHDTYTWLLGLGVKFCAGLRDSQGNSVLRTHTITPDDVLPLLLEKAEATGLVETIYGAQAWQLVTNPQSGRVIGVEVDGEESLPTAPATASFWSRVGVATASVAQVATLSKASSRSPHKG